MNQILDKNKRYRYDGKQDVWVECDDLIPSVIRLPAPLPKPPNPLNYLKDNIMTTNTQNTVTENSLFSEFISADIGYWIKPSDKVKFKPIKVNDYDVIFTRNNIGSLKDCFDYLKLHGDIKGSLTQAFKDKCLEKKVIFIDTDTLQPITDVESLINGYSRCEIEISNISVSGVINNLKKDKKMNGDQIAKYLNNTINECYNLALEFYAIGEVNKPVTSLSSDSNLIENNIVRYKSFNVKNNDGSDKRDYFIPELLPKGVSVILAADPKSCKTLFSYDLAACYLLNQEFLGYQFNTTIEKVMIIQSDESEADMYDKLSKRLEQGANDRLKVWTDFKLTYDDIKLLDKAIVTEGIKLVIIDSLKRISAGLGLDENSSAYGDLISALDDVIKKHNINLVILHHTNKSPDNKGVNRLRGSSAIAAAVYGVWLLEKTGNDTIKFTTDSRGPNKSYELKLIPDNLTFDMVESDDDDYSDPIKDEEIVPNDFKEVIYNLIKSGVSDIKSLAKETGKSESYIRGVIPQLTRSGRVERDYSIKGKQAFYKISACDDVLVPYQADKQADKQADCKPDTVKDTADDNVTACTAYTPIPSDKHKQQAVIQADKPKLEIVNNETTKSQYSGQTIQLTVELQKVYDAVVQSSKDDYESIQIFELSMKYLNSCDLTKLENDLEQLVTMGLLYKPWPDEYALAF